MIEISQPNNPVIGNSRLQAGWPILLLVSGSAWLFAMGMLIAIPADPKNSQLLGYSTSRLVLFGAASLFFLIHLGMAWQSKLKPEFRQRVLDPFIIDRKKFRICIILLSFVFIGLWFSMLITDGFHRPTRLFLPYAAYIERLHPFIVSLFLECLILIIGFLIMRYGIHLDSFRKEKTLWVITLGVTVSFLLLGIVMAITGFGILPDRVGWGKPGVPVLFYQTMLAWLGGLFFCGLLLLSKKQVSNWPGRLLDLAICLALWSGAVWSWSGQDVQRSYFSPSPLPPNNEIYPYSDAGYYDYNAQSLLLGYGFVEQVVPRPLYILLLAGFHAIAGQGYEKTIFVQTLFLALLPVFLYALGKEMHSRPLGLSLGILAIVRESNSILSTPWVEVSNSKLLLADLPTTIVVVALTWLSFRWLARPKHDWPDAILVGGALGIASLFRTQTLILLPVLLLLAAWCYRSAWKVLLKAAIMFMLGLVLVISPWLMRNWVKTGNLVFDDPTTQNALLAQRYSTEIGEMPAQKPGETQSDYALRITDEIRQFVLTNPFSVARFVSTHTLNNLVSSVLVLPMRVALDERCDTQIICSPFWISIIDQFSWMDALLLSTNLFLAALGIATSFRRWKVVGLVPLIFLLAYSISNGLARNSARRYILPVDWVAYFYLLIGLFELAFWSAILFGVSAEKFQRILTLKKHDEPQDHRRSYPKLVFTSVLLLCIGVSIPLTEISVRPHLPDQSKSEQLDTLLNSPNFLKTHVSEIALRDLMKQDNAVLLEGSIFYPRFYMAGEGEPGSGWPAYKPYEYRETSKIGAVLIGPGGMKQVNLAIDSSPDNFPNASDVIIVGCQEQNYIDALLVYFTGADQIITRSDLRRVACPLK